jgi:trimeric autotransporter adhesin
VFKLIPPSLTVTGTSVNVSPGATGASTITLTPGGAFTGNVALTAAIKSSPAGAQDLPMLSFGSTSPVKITGGSAGTATLTITTTAATSASLIYPARPRVGWYCMGLVPVLLVGVPARSRRARLGILTFLMIFAAGFMACGGGGGSGGGGSVNRGTTPGAYTVTVSGTSGSTTATGTVTLTVH